MPASRGQCPSRRRSHRSLRDRPRAIASATTRSSAPRCPRPLPRRGRRRASVATDCCSTPKAATPARRLLRANSGSVVETPAAAMERKPGPSAAEFRFDPIVIRGSAASTWTDACSDSARCRALGPIGRMLLLPPMEVRLGLQATYRKSATRKDEHDMILGPARFGLPHRGGPRVQERCWQLGRSFAAGSVLGSWMPVRRLACRRVGFRRRGGRCRSGSRSRRLPGMLLVRARSFAGRWGRGRSRPAGGA
jgi:hypothetical protein